MKTPHPHTDCGVSARIPRPQRAPAHPDKLPRNLHGVQGTQNSQHHPEKEQSWRTRTPQQLDRSQDRGSGARGHRRQRDGAESPETAACAPAATGLTRTRGRPTGRSGLPDRWRWTAEHPQAGREGVRLPLAGTDLGGPGFGHVILDVTTKGTKEV